MNTKILAAIILITLGASLTIGAYFLGKRSQPSPIVHRIAILPWIDIEIKEPIKE